jgi:hypothetical protein
MPRKIRWAPRVPMDWIQLLYERDGQGIVDDELLDKVGYRLYDRCCDSIAVSESVTGNFICLACRMKATLRDDVIRCDACRWTCSLNDFRSAWRHLELNADTTFMKIFVRSWMAARSAREKMIAINDVIHRWHHETKLAEKGAVGRPVGVNLIEGSRKQVIAFLDRLTDGADHERWVALKPRR